MSIKKGTHIKYNPKSGFQKGHPKYEGCGYPKGHHPPNEFKKGENLGELNHNWKGEKSSYVAKHQWIVRKLGQPDTCEFCGKRGLSGHKIHWANKSKQYKHETTDWIRLCVPCHKLYDIRRKKIDRDSEEL